MATFGLGLTTCGLASNIIAAKPELGTNYRSRVCGSLGLLQGGTGNCLDLVANAAEHILLGRMRMPPHGDGNDASVEGSDLLTGL